MKKLIILLFLIMLNLNLLAKEKFFSERPSWVKKTELSELEPSEENLDHSIKYILFESQINVEEEKEYFHHIRRVQNEEGLSEESELSFDYDPAYQKLEIHSILIIRDGKEINLYDESKIKVIQRESNLERKLYDGTLTALYLLENIRIGDIIEYDFSRIGYNPAFKDKFSETLWFSWGVPVENVRYRITVPKSRNLKMRKYNIELESDLINDGEYKIYEWKHKNSTEVIVDNNIPYWYNPDSHIQISEFSSLSEVAKITYSLYDFDVKIEKELEEKISELKNKSEDKKEFILNVIRYIQDEIKYLGLEYGISGYKPSDPNLTNKRRFGDCKDKAFLFTVIMRNEGIEAYPVLVNTDYKRKIKSWLPSYTNFDHVISKFIFEGKEYWIDLTMSLQGGDIDSIAIGDFGYGMVISDKTGFLEKIPNKNLLDSKINGYEQYYINSYDEPVELKIVATYTGIEADNMRSYFRANTKTSISKYYLDYISKFYETVEEKNPVKYTDDRDKNIFTVTENYIISNMWKENAEENSNDQWFYPTLIFDNIPNVKFSNRKMPYALRYPLDISNTVEIKMPEIWDLEGETNSVENECFLYNSERVYDEKNVIINFEYKSKKDFVSPDEFKQFYTDIEKVRDELGDNLYVGDDVSGGGYYFNWSILLLILFYTIIIIYSCISLYKNNFYINREDNNVIEEHNGIKGWLLVIFVSLIVSLLINILNLKEYTYIINLERWVELIAPSSKQFNQLLAMSILFSIFSSIFLVSMNITLIVGFVNKKVFVPKLIILLLVIIIALQIIDYAFIANVESIENSIKIENFKEIFLSIIRASILTPYLLLSKQVKRTFIK